MPFKTIIISFVYSTIYFGDDYVVVKNESGIWNESYTHQDGTLVGILDERGNKK